jgi:hypothetical protein
VIGIEIEGDYTTGMFDPDPDSDFDFDNPLEICQASESGRRFFDGH